MLYIVPNTNVLSTSDDQTTVRVTNLSEDAQEADLRDLFGFFGQIRRIFLAKDKITQQSKVEGEDETCASSLGGVF